MNFNIVSAPEQRLTADTYKQFKDDYLHSTMTYHELKHKYGLSKKEYGETIKRIKAEENITYKPVNNAKHFYDVYGKYRVIKRCNGKNVLFGTLPKTKFSEQDMINIVNKCKEWRWDYEKCTRYIKSLGN